MAFRLHARAKVNLCLHVTGQRDDGYHLLDSIVAFADVADVLTFTPAQGVILTIDGPFGMGLSGEQDNLILRAARCFNTPSGCAIHLQKNLPVASGIGGGSADAAATLIGLSRFWDMPLPDLATQLSLGADVPVCVVGRTVRMQGIGAEITPVSGLPALPAVLINPGVGVSTPSVFGALASKNNAAISRGDRDVEWLRQQRNDLQPAAIQQAPVIAEVLKALCSANATLTRMSGSGATCFGFFDTVKQAQTTADNLRAQHPDWWVQATVLNGSDDAGHHEIC